MSQLELTITTPLDIIYSDSVDQVTVTTSSGEITILPNHVPIISTLQIGHVFVKKGENETYFAIDGGLIEVRRDHRVVILSDRSENALEIDTQRAKEAVHKAQEYLKNPSSTDYSYKKLQSMITKEENRTRVARRGGRK